MKVIIAGSRSLTNFALVKFVMERCPFAVTEIVSGTAGGIDILGERYASLAKIPVIRMPAEWNKLGRRAGFVRNEKMGEYADALVAIWDNKSNGTRHMLNFMNNIGKPILLARVTRRQDGTFAVKLEKHNWQTTS